MGKDFSCRGLVNRKHIDFHLDGLARTRVIIRVGNSGSHNKIGSETRVSVEILTRVTTLGLSRTCLEIFEICSRKGLVGKI